MLDSNVNVSFIFFLNAAGFQDQNFGPFPIRGAEQFAQTQLSFAFVNLKPIVEGNNYRLLLVSCVLQNLLMMMK